MSSSKPARLDREPAIRERALSRCALWSTHLARLAQKWLPKLTGTKSSRLRRHNVRLGSPLHSSMNFRIETQVHTAK